MKNIKISLINLIQKLTGKEENMLNSKQSMYCLLLLAIIVLIIGTGYSNAASISEDNLTDNDLAKIDMTNEKNPETCIKEDKTIRTLEKTDTNNVKGENELQPISIYTEDIECNYGDVVSMDVTTDPEVDEGLLTWYVNEKLVGVKNLSTSAASYELRTGNYRPGTYEIMVSYSNSISYQNNHTTANLTIRPLNTQVKNIVYDFDPENNIEVTLNVVGSDDEILDYGTLNIYREENLIDTLEIEDYDVSFTLDKSCNMEIVTFEYIGDSFYSTSRTEHLVYVEKLDCDIYLPYMTGYHSSTISQSVTFYTNKAVNDGKLHVYINGVLTDEITVNSSDMELEVDLSEYPEGTYPVYIEYVDSDVYNDAAYHTTLKVNRIPTTLYTSNITAHKNDMVNLRASIYNFVDQTDEGMLEFLIDDESIKTTLVNNTTTTEGYLIPENLAYGQHTLMVKYHGTQKYAPSQVSAQLNIIKYPNSLSIKNYTINSQGSIEINVREYSYENTVDDGVIEYYVNGTPAGSVNVESNVTTITLPEEYTGDNEYEIMLKYTGSEKFEDANMTANIRPEKYNTTTRIYDFINNKNILNITSYVYSTKYDDINEGAIKFYLDDNAIGIVDVENNRANIVYDMDNMTEKMYTIKTEYTGTNLYRNSTNQTSINYTINRKTIYIRTDTSITAAPSEDIDIKANITDYEGNTINLTTTAKITIGTEEITVPVTEGHITYTHHIASYADEETTNITIDIARTKYYKEATRSIRLNIQKNSPYITSQNTIRTNKGENVLINATLNLNHDILNENISAILKINNRTVYQGIFTNGQFQYKLALGSRYTSNTYNITIKTKETPLYHTAQKDITLNLNPRNTYITSKNIVAKNGERIYINATVYDTITRTTVNGTSRVNIKINEKTLENINATNGKILYSYINDYSAKDYNITIIYGENGIYNESRWNGTLNITSAPLKIRANNINTNAYKTINIKADILDDNKPATGTIKTAIKISNKTIMELNVTDGKIDVNYTLPDTIGAGNYNLTIIAGNTRKYTMATTDVQLIVNRNYQHIETSDITAAKASPIKIRAQLLDQDNNQVNRTTKVNIKIAGHTITDMNVSNGTVEYDYTIEDSLELKNYDILIQAGENSGYHHATTHATLKVE